MELTTRPRDTTKISQARQLRRQGDIPAVVYSSRSPGAPIIVDGNQFKSALRNLKKNHLPNTVFTLTSENGAITRAIVKEIQYHRVNYDILHIDLFELIDSELITVNIPVEMLGHADCVGVKAGGALRLVKRHVRVQCLPQDLPQDLKLDVQDLQIKESKRVRDLHLLDGVKILAHSLEVIAVVGKR